VIWALADAIKASDFVAWIAPVVKSIANVIWLEWAATAFVETVPASVDTVVLNAAASFSVSVMYSTLPC
jgi:hypothetical protein